MPELCLIACAWGPGGGGIEQVNRDIARVFLGLGWKITVLGTNPSRRDPTFGGARVHLTRLAFRNKVLDRLYRKILRPLFERPWVSWRLRNVDLVIFSHAYRLERFPYLLHRKRCWLWMHGIEVWGANRNRLFGHEGVLSHVVSVSDFTLRHVRETIALPKTSVIPNAVDVERYAPTLHLGQVRRDRILIVSRLASGRPKGHEALFPLLPRLRDALGHPVLLDIVGDGPDRARLETLATAQGVETLVRFHGRVSEEDLLELFQHSHLFCMPAPVGIGQDGLWYGEGFGIVYIQAAACGRPVIASNHGGAVETLLDGISGFAVDPQDPDALFEKLLLLFKAPGLADQMGMKGREYVASRFSFDAFSQKIQALVP